MMEQDRLNTTALDLSARLRTMVPMGRAFTVEERAAAAIVSQEGADEIDRLWAENARLRSLMSKAYAVMRAHGWQLAPASVGRNGQELLALAAAEVVSEFGAVLGGIE